MTTRRSLTGHLLDNVELWLSGAGLLVILLVPSLAAGGAPHSTTYWAVMAVTALIVGVLHGMIFWLIRRRQRRLRAEAIAELRVMLRDRINNELTTLLSHLDDANAGDLHLVERIRGSTQSIADLLSALSEESLTDWRTRYQPGT